MENVGFKIQSSFSITNKIFNLLLIIGIFIFYLGDTTTTHNSAICFLCLRFE